MEAADAIEQAEATVARLTVERDDAHVAVRATMQRADLAESIGRHASNLLVEYEARATAAETRLAAVRAFLPTMVGGLYGRDQHLMNAAARVKTLIGAAHGEEDQ